MPDFPSSSSASGIWQMRQVKRAVQGGNWPAVIDPQFNYVTMLLPGNGTNGAQNNTFLDSSTNNYTITRNGNSTQGTFTPYGLNWSNYFNNSTGLGLAYGTATHTFWNNSFTLELWVNCPTKSFAAVISSWFDSNFGGGSWQLAITTGIVGLSNFQSSGTNQGSFITSGSTRVDDGQWHHIAITQVTGANKIFRLFIDGVLRGYKVENNWTQSAASSTIYIGNQGPGTFDEANRYMLGYLSNLRLTTSVVSAYSTTSTALGTTVFTPPTAPLSVISGTNILTCADNRFIDDSTNNFAITRLGDVSVQNFSPFAPTTSYAAGTIGGSAYFDGTGDSLSFPQNTAQLSNSDFSVEAWVYPFGGGDITMLIGNTDDTTIAGSSYGFYAQRSGSNSFMFFGGSNVQIAAPSPIRNAWNHIVYARTSGTWSCFLNGTRFSTASANVTVNNGASNFPPSINRYTSGNSTSACYMAGFRFLLGSSAYNATLSTLTVPTTIPTAVANTRYLPNFTNAGIIDNAMMNDLETVGNAQISTSVSKFGGGSMAFDGTGDYLVARNTPVLDFGGGDFTIEAWVYMSSSTGIVLSQWNNGGNNSNYVYVSGGVLIFRVGGSEYSGGSISTSTWTHIAISRASGTVRLFINGSSVASATNTSNITSTSATVIGANDSGIGGANFFNGYIDDLRITRGYARYTSNFSVPTAPFPTQ